MNPFACFLAALSFFHVSEFTLAAIYDRENLGLHSWLFSKPYCAVMLAACAEYWAELRWAPGLKVAAVSWAGLAAVAAGELLRKAAMVTAAHNFTHVIQTRRRERHRLVTHGVYAWVRHPGYAGWALWALGMQALLCNPACAALSAAACWRFFSRRCRYEDATLARFFGEEYERYRAATPSGLPGVP